MRPLVAPETSSLEYILGEQKQKQTTSLTVLAVMLLAGVILLVAKLALGWLFIVMGVLLAAGYAAGSGNFRKMLDVAGGVEGLREQMESPDARKFRSFSLVITPDLAVKTAPVLKVYKLADMQKFEVGLGSVQKALFLTDRAGNRNKIAETQKGDGLDQEFDSHYDFVRDLFHSRLEA